MGLAIFDYNKRLILLSVILSSGGLCISCLSVKLAFLKSFEEFDNRGKIIRGKNIIVPFKEYSFREYSFGEYSFRENA